MLFKFLYRDELIDKNITDGFNGGGGGGVLGAIHPTFWLLCPYYVLQKFLYFIKHFNGTITLFLKQLEPNFK